MKILKARVEEHGRYMNQPELQVLVDKMPEWDELRWEHDGRRLWWAVKDGMFYKFSHSVETPERNEGGYGGCVYPLIMKDGSEVLLAGPWSSRTACFHHLYPAFEASIFEYERDWERGYTACAGALTLTTAVEAIKMVPRSGVWAYRLAFCWDGKEYVRQILKVKDAGRFVDTYYGYETMEGLTEAPKRKSSVGEIHLRTRTWQEVEDEVDAERERDWDQLAKDLKAEALAEEEKI